MPPMEGVTDSVESRARRVAERLRPRVAASGFDEVMGLAARLVAERPNEDEELVATRLVARADGRIAPAGFDYERSPLELPSPPLTAIERRLRLADALADVAPPELLDGSPIQWAPTPLDRATVLSWWRRWLERRDAGTAPARLQVYAHVPWCRTRCGFCQFRSVVTQDEQQMGSFVADLEREAADFVRELGRLGADATTIGGGTPSHLTAGQLERVLGALRGALVMRDGDYFSVELNPDSTTRDKVRLLADAGVNRVSLGVQSLHEPTLRAVQRGYQTTEMVERAIEAVQSTGRLQLGLDLIASLPGETPKTFRAGVRRVLALGPDQLVVYEYQPVARGAHIMPAGEVSYGAAAEIVAEEASHEGYEPVADSGASVVVQRPGTRRFRTRYVQHPREPSSLLGFGPFAESHVFGVGHYVGAAPDEGPQPYRGETIDPEVEKARFVGRLLGAGLPIDGELYQQTFGEPMERGFPTALAWLEERGLLYRDDGKLVGRFPDRDVLRRSAWLFLDERTLDRIGANTSPERVPQRARSWLRAHTNEASDTLLQLVDDPATTGWAAFLRLGHRGTEPRLEGRLRPELAVDGLADPRARRWLELAGISQDVVVRILDRLLEAGTLAPPRLRSHLASDRTLTQVGFDFEAPAAGALAWLLPAFGLDEAHLPNATALRRVESMWVCAGADRSRRRDDCGQGSLWLQWRLSPQSTLFHQVARGLPQPLVRLARTSGELRYQRRCADGAGALVLRRPPEAEAREALPAPLAERWRPLSGRRDAQACHIEALEIPLDRARPRPDDATLTLAPASPRPRRRLALRSAPSSSPTPAGGEDANGSVLSLVRSLGLRGDVPLSPAAPTLRLPRLELPLEVLAFRAGLKPVVFLTVRPEQADAVAASLGDVHIETRERRVRVRPGDVWEDRRDEGEPHVELYAARDPEHAHSAAALQADSDPSEHLEAIGELMGYPPCCVRAFGEQDDRSDNTENRYAAFRRTIDVGLEPPWPFELNELFVKTIPFFPCSYGCERALAFARATLGELHRTDPAASELLERVVARPVLYMDHDHQIVLEGTADTTRARYDAVALPADPEDGLAELAGAFGSGDTLRWEERRVVIEKKGVEQLRLARDAPATGLLFPFGPT